MSDLYDFNEEAARTLLTHLRALSRSPLSAENLAKKFSPESGIGKEAVKAFADALEYWGNQTRIRTFLMNGNGYLELFMENNLIAIKRKKPKNFQNFISK